MFTLIIEDKHGGIADEYSFEEGEFFIGRSHTSDIILPSDNVSRRHARLYTVDGRCYIEDLASSNGVFVNGRRIAEVYQIQRSAQIKIGDYYLHIESDTEAGPEEERTYCRLTGRNLAFAGQVFRVQRKVNLIGRGKDCTLTIIDPSVSRIHTKLSVERSGALTVEDLKSSNGTWVNGERVDVATLHHRDLLRLGNVEFLVEMADQEGAAVASKPTEREREVKRDRVEERERELRRDRVEERERELRRDRVEEREPLVPPATTTAAPTLEDRWGPPPKSGMRTWVVWTIAIAIVAAIGGTFVLLFREELFGAPEPVAPAVTTTPPPAPTREAPPPGPSPEEEAAAAAREAEKKKQDIQAILDVGKDHFRGRRWELALGRYQAVLELDPLNEEARRAVNQIKIMEQHKQRLEEARRLRDALKRGEAARLLREIDDASVYYVEAQEELAKLQEAKPTLKLTAENLLRQKDCQGAITTLKELQQIDPKDAEVGEQLEAVNKLVGTRKCND